MREERGAITGDAGGKRRKFLREFGGTAVGAFRPFPIAGADEDFAVLIALLAMKFVDRHGEKITRRGEIASAFAEV